MKIRDFGVEIWMNLYETKCQLNLAETCVESLTVGQLLEMSGKTDSLLQDIKPMQLTYGAIQGSQSLRSHVASLYEKQTLDNVIITHGAIGANALIYQTLIEPKDRVISFIPTYQQHYSIPESYGADVQILKLTPENNFLPNLEELRSAAIKGTKLIAITNPNNPTGTLMDKALLLEIVKIARECGAWLLCDEVYRGTDQLGEGITVSAADLYEKSISIGSMSKAFSLAGLRLGWIVGPQKLLEDVSIHRDYNTISVGMLDDYFATLALQNKDKILKRSQDITRKNLALLSDWVDQEPLISWVKPTSGTTAFLQLNCKMKSHDFCLKLLEETGVMLTPGSVMDMEGYVRLGYANNSTILQQGLEKISAFLKKIEQAEKRG